jgi:hypothetical protein
MPPQRHPTGSSSGKAPDGGRRLGRCLCLFEAADPDLVRNVNDIAQFPMARVMAVLSSVPDGAQT